MDQLARGGLVSAIACIADPVRQTVAAKTRQPHQLDILRVVPVAQVPDEPPEPIKVDHLHITPTPIEEDLRCALPIKALDALIEARSG